jgi:hypothetical protein
VPPGPPMGHGSRSRTGQQPKQYGSWSRRWTDPLRPRPCSPSLNSSPKDTFILLSNNPGKPHPGGTCFGDSGGPTFDDTNSNLVVAVTSFGFSSTCSGVGGAYRLDQPDDLAFLASFGITS